MKFSVHLFAALMFWMSALTSQPVQAVELGLKPSDVFALWTNINRMVLDLGRFNLADDIAIEALQNMEINRQRNKTPSDVLGKVADFTALIEPLHIHFRGESDANLLERQIVFLVRHNKTETTPSIVFMRSSDIMVNMAHILAAYSDHEPLISPYFMLEDFYDKTPSDVYALVELATHRLEYVSKHPGFHHVWHKAKPE